MNVKRIIIGILIVAVLVAGGYWAYLQYLAPVPEEAEATPDLNELSVDTGVDVVSAEGVVVPLRRARLAFPAGGRVAAILAEEGETVPAGAPLVRLEAEELEVALDQAEAAVAQAEAGVQAAQAQRAAAQAGVTAAEIGVRAAQAQLDLAQAQPITEEVAVLQEQITAANAAIAQADAQRDATVSGATAAQIAAAEAELAAARAEEETLRVQYNQLVFIQKVGGPEEEQLRHALEAAEEATDAAQVALDELLAGATEEQQRGANAGVAAAVAQRDAAQAQLDLLLAGPRPEQVTIYDVGVEQAEAAVAQAQTAVDQAEAAVAQAEANLTQARAGRDAAQAALDRMTLTAPFTGTVAAVNVEVGETVAPAVPVVQFGGMAGWQVETTDLTELDVVAVSVGQPVDVRVDALPDETIPGRVTDIATTATPARGDVTYTVTIALEDTAGLPLRWGMTAFVDVDV